MGSLRSECQQIQNILTANNYEASIVEYGTEQFEQAQPDLVIISTMLPNLDPSTLIEQIRQKQTASFIPVLLITPDDSSNMLHRLEEGANDYIATPVEPDRLLERVQVILKWKQLIDELIQINQQQEDFVACLLHDLRSPLSATNQVLRQVLQGVFGSTLLELESALNQIVQSNQNLLQMVEALLDGYRYAARQQSLDFIPVNLIELSQQIITQMAPLANQKGLSLTLNLEAAQELEPSAIVVLGDRSELYRLLLNLISNSIQYTENGFIEMRLYSPIAAEAPDSQQVILEVEDSGIGIPAETLETVFERFQRSTSSRRGYGLGLYLSRQIVEAHQGTITVRSEQGRGSVFTICLPAHTDN